MQTKPISFEYREISYVISKLMRKLYHRKIVLLDVKWQLQQITNVKMRENLNVEYKITVSAELFTMRQHLSNL